MPRKHLIANKTNKKQQDNAKIWQKLANEIKVAAAVGGKNPEANPRLKTAIERALDANLSRDSINKNINGYNKDDKILTENEYEFFAEGGLKIIIHVLTDNTNRTLANINSYTGKLNANLAKTNSVKSSFSDDGIFFLEKSDQVDELFLMNLLSDFSIIDINEVEDENSIELVVKNLDFYPVKKVLENNNIVIKESSLDLLPLETITPNEQLKAKVDKLLLSCEQDPDIQWVATNISPN